jgi:hypothetical protein
VTISTDKFVLPKNINYLHYGDALEKLQVIRDYSAVQRVPKLDVLAKINGSNQSSKYASYIIERYGCRRRKTIDVACAIADLDQSISTQSSFRALQSRGFSYRFSTKPTGFPAQLRQDINVRVALFGDTRSHYPPAVLKFLTYTRRCHFYDWHGPAIAFLLGVLKGRRLYIVTLQSDVTYDTPSAVKEHFRGWRRILLNLTMMQFQPKTCFLVRSEDVLRACHNGFKVPEKVPMSWRNIYEQSAIESENESTTLKRGVNIQIYSRHPKVIAKQFHVLK